MEVGMVVELGWGMVQGHLIDYNINECRHLVIIIISIRTMNNIINNIRNYVCGGGGVCVMPNSF